MSSPVPPRDANLGQNLKLTCRIMGNSNIRNQKSPHLPNASSPLISALQNPSDLLSRSIPFSPFRTGSPSSGAPNSLGSTAGGVGLSGGPSPPPSAPASYSSGAGFSASRQVRGYPGFEEHGSAPYGASGGYYTSTQRSAGGPLNGGAHLQLGENNYACELSTIDELGFVGGNARVVGNGVGGDNVICLGWEGGVDVWRIGRNTVELVGRLEGLRGGVKGAKILPNPPLNDPLAAHRPLICLTIHSPIVRGSESDGDAETAIQTLDAESPYSTSPPSRPETSNSHRSSQNGDPASDWQTTVEVWSLATRSRICKLFISPLIPAADIGLGIQAPPPVWGNLRVQVTGDKIVVGVGSSGELYIFGVETSSGAGRKGGKEQPKTEWKCLDKVWTCAQPPLGQQTPLNDGFGGGASFGLTSTGTPIFDLSGRWLAYCPASMGAISAGGEVGVRIASHSVMAPAPPSQPSISAAVALEDEAFLNRMAREVTQEVIRGAKWAADAGYKKIQSYMNGGMTNGNSPPQPYAAPIGMGITGKPQPNNPQPSGLGQQLRQMQQMGGPQQSQQLPQYVHEPRLVSVIDLQKYNSTCQDNTPPMATFLPPAGVSFMSFSPGGLSLLTASSKGDILFIWDLLKVVHHPPGSLNQRAASGPGSTDPGLMTHSTDILGRHVRQIARFTRMTVATIVDVDWSSPRGEKIAVITERGTAHFYDLPYAALQWPPPRRPPPSSSAVSTQTTAAGAVVSNAVNLFNSSTQPLLTAARRRRSRSSSVGSPGGGMFGSPSAGRRPSGAPGTSPNDPPAGGNRIPLPPSPSGASPGCIKFLTAKERGYVAVLGGGLLRIYELRPGGSGKKGSKTGGVVSGNWWEYDLPQIPAAPEQSFSERAEGKAGGFWGFRSHWNRGGGEDDSGNGADGPWKTPLAWAEIETNSAFVPWHQERRVKMFVYDPPTYQTQLLCPPTPPPETKPAPSPVTASHAPVLSPNPLSNWESDESAHDSDSGVATTPSKPGTKRGKRVKSPPLPPSPNVEMTEAVLADVATATVLDSTPVTAPPSPPKERWVFGLPMEAERIFLSDAGGRGDVTFGGEGQGGLEAAMKDGLKLEVEVRREEGFFEEDVEVLDFA